MTKTITAEFEVTQWDTSTYDGDLFRVTVGKTFRGEMAGTSVAELLGAGASEGGRGYVASERFTGSIDGRHGTVVFQHGGIDDGVAPYTFGNIIPGTGTGDLAGLTGQITFVHDETGARVTLTLN